MIHISVWSQRARVLQPPASGKVPLLLLTCLPVWLWLLLQLEDIGARVFFEKQLTSSDVSASGRVVVPKVRPCQAGRGSREQ